MQNIKGMKGTVTVTIISLPESLNAIPVVPGAPTRLEYYTSVATVSDPSPLLIFIHRVFMIGNI